ncbi:MAG: NAD(P)-dependent oxidoreductase [Bacteroidaceae bacterium]|nr:NAD(P)-dependent oxidoreductase [Bacteroidaceae bacterium]
MKILITGASGFIGSFLCEEGLRRGHEIWAGVREHSSRRYLQLQGLGFLTLDLSDRTVLSRQLAAVGSPFDVIIHAGGATKCLDRNDFMRNNYDCTRNFVDVLTQLDMIPRQFIYVSSYSVIGPSVYGASKLRSEEYIKSLGDFPYVIFRPTGVYGPREKDYFVMAQSIARHLDFAVGQEQKLTFIYVDDLVGAIFAAVDKGVAHRTYNVADGHTYESRVFSDLLRRELAVRHVIHVKAPLWLLHVVTSVSDWWARNVTHRPTTLNRDKYLIMSQRDWTCDITPLKEELGFTPQWDLEHGVKQTIKWYKENHWL